MSRSFPYIPGKQIKENYPLKRFLPPINNGMAAEWLRENIPPGGIILDPYGSSPNLIIEIANAGYPIIVAANNPILRFLIEVFAEHPTKTQLNSALAELATASKGNDRIEPYIRSLYTTECPQCGKSTEVESFLWEKDSAAPYGRIINCQYCGESGEHQASQTDIENAIRYSSSTLHYARALERIAPPRHPDRIHAEEAVTVYLPRGLYVLFTLINKIDALDTSLDDKKLINAILLTTFDFSNNLWGYPTSRERPKSLSVPPRFRENNIWMSLEKSIDLWANVNPKASVNINHWPAKSIDSGMIYLYAGRLRSLVDTLGNNGIAAVITALPRPNQAFWSLSALWTGWLWGREALGQFISAIRRRRYDWHWHTTALYSANKHLSKILAEDTHFLGIIGEAEIGFLTSVLIAANNAGFRLIEISPRFESAQAQIVWQYTTKKPTYLNEHDIKNILLSSGMKYLKIKGEPANYLQLHTSSIAGIYKDRVINHPTGVYRLGTYTSDDSNVNMSTSPSQDYSNIQSLIRNVLNNPMNYQRFTESESSESGYWGLIDESNYQLPQSDHVEELVVEQLITNQKLTLEEIDRVCCSMFPGLYTPSAELIHVCLDSYAYKLQLEDKWWQLRDEDIPAKRQDDIENIKQQLHHLGIKLGYKVASKPSKNHEEIIIWLDTEKEEIYKFYIISTAVIGDIILNLQTSSKNPIIVLPGGRANLVAYKIRRDPRLAEKLRDERTFVGLWRFLKFRHVRWLYENPLLSSENMDQQLNLDPLTYTTPQLRLL